MISKNIIIKLKTNRIKAIRLVYTALRYPKVNIKNLSKMWGIGFERDNLTIELMM